MTIRKSALSMISLWLLIPSLAQAQLPVRVQAYAQHIGSHIVYHYKIINDGNDSVTGINIGHRFERGAYIPGKGEEFVIDSRELTILPVGFDDNGLLPSTSATAPNDWQGGVGLQEENPHHMFHWTASDPQRLGVQPGEALGGFSITLPEPDQRHLTGHFYAFMGDGQEHTGQIQSLDLTPPKLTVSTLPTILSRHNKKLIPIATAITVTDNYDPQPQIKLESIVANEPLEKDDIRDAHYGTDDRTFKLKAEREGKNKAGRIYTVTYSATDASGNKATASATVTVPHDRRKDDDRKDVD